MCCGKPATGLLDHTFTTSPSWVLVFVVFGILPYFVIEFVYRLFNRMKVEIPLCVGHYTHFSRRRYWYYGGLAVLVLFPLAFYISHRLSFDLLAQAWLPAAILMPGAFVLFLMGCLTGIKAYDSNPDGMMVCDVAPEFAKAYEDSFYHPYDLDVPPRRKSRAEDKVEDNSTGIEQRD
jgi:hypothetical protein